MPPRKRTKIGGPDIPAAPKVKYAMAAPTVSDICEAPGCDVDQNNRPMCFKGMPWCSDNHRKLIQTKKEAK